MSHSHHQPGPPSSRPAPSLGSVHADEVMPSAVFRARMGVGVKGWREMLHRGLRAVHVGRQTYVLGSDVIAFLGRMAADRQQTAPPAQEATR